MPAWSEARRAAQTARQSQIKDRSDPRHNYSAGWYRFDSKGRQCFFCRRRHGRMVTGHMSITGPVWFHPGGECEQDYRENKTWEEQHK